MAAILNFLANIGDGTHGPITQIVYWGDGHILLTLLTDLRLLYLWMVQVLQVGLVHRLAQELPKLFNSVAGGMIQGHILEAHLMI